MFYAHAGVLAKSCVLEKVVTGWASETQHRKIKWPEWSADIIDKFLEWLYTGDYTIPYPKEVVRPEMHDSDVQFHESAEGEAHEEGVAPEGFPVELQEQEWNSSAEAEPVQQPDSPRALTSYLEPRKTGPLTPLNDLAWEGCRAAEKTTHAETFDPWMLLNNSLYPLDYEATFMTHATLYVIACQKDLADLKNMAWQRLRALLVEIGAPDAESPIIGNMVALIQYTYRETGVSELPEDPLRDLVTSYVAIYFTKFRGAEVDALFSSRAADDREFVVEIMDKVRQSMENLEATTGTIASTGTVFESTYQTSKKNKKKPKVSGSKWFD